MLGLVTVMVLFVTVVKELAVVVAAPVKKVVESMKDQTCLIDRHDAYCPF